MSAKTQAELLALVDSYIEANTASNGHLRLEGADAEYEAGYADGLVDGRDALAESIAVAGKLVRLFNANANQSAYDKGYFFALSDIVYTIENGVLPGMGTEQAS